MRSRLALVAAAALLAGFSPFEREEENVRAGNARLREGDAAGARQRYDAAERAVGKRPEIEFDRGHAALLEGRREDAEAAWRRAAEAAPGPLASRALQNVGTARARAGDEAGAARAFEDALLADPGNEDARWNLEVLLRRQADPGGEPGAGRAPAAGGEGRGGAPGGERESAPRPERAAGPEERDAPADGPGAAARPDAGDAGARRGDGDRRAPRSRREAEALLDALRAREQDPPVFGSRREREDGRRADGAKDW